MRKFIALAMILAGAALAATAETERSAGSSMVAVLDIEGAIGPASSGYFEKAHRDAVADGASAIILRMDTPGGLDSAMRDMIKVILGSSVPVIGYVGPEGARAASAGTYLLYASHIAVMAPATNLGAATPVPVGGAPTPGQPPRGGEDRGEGNDSNGDDADAASEDAEESEREGADGDAMQKKILNDAIAYIRGLAEKRGRNADWAEKAVREGVSLTATEALEKNVINHVASSLSELLGLVDGTEVDTPQGAVTLAVADARLEYYEPDWRFKFLAIITNPTIAYMLMLVGIYGLLLEGYSPGAILPGTIGAISLLMALYAFQVLPVNYVGLALIALGIILMIAEALAPSFGVLGFGGVVGFVLGSILLMDSDVPGFGINVGVIAAAALAAALLMLLTIYLLYRSRRMPIATGDEGTVDGQVAVVKQFADGQGWAVLTGETWRIESSAELTPGQRVRVVRHEGFRVVVEPID
jgi:membrane-bound serine protease (ClpP class)